jgi:hypothetical protein
MRGRLDRQAEMRYFKEWSIFFAFVCGLWLYQRLTRIQWTVSHAPER